MARIVGVGVAIAFASGCGGGGAAAFPDGPADDIVTSYTVTTDKGAITMETHQSWAPNGVGRFGDLVAADFYNDARFFRVISGFVAQFGINGTPSTNAMWSSRTIPDDPVVRSNTRGYVTYAQTSEPNSRTTQLFINTVDNSDLDGMGFAPFALVTDGMEVVDQLDAEYGDQPDQGMIAAGGNAYLTANFPNLDYIISVTTP